MDSSDPPGSESNPGEIDRSPLLLALLVVLAVVAIFFAIVQQADLREAAGARTTAESARVESEQPGHFASAIQLIAEFKHEGQILAASLSPEGQHLQTIGGDGLVQLIHICLDADDRPGAR